MNDYRLPSSLCKPSLRTYFDWEDNWNEDYPKRPALLDLFAGGGGCSVGYYLSGFRCYGIDNKPQKHYPFPYICMDALEAMDRLLRGEGLTFSNDETLYLKDFAAFHASPPCHFYSITRNIHTCRDKNYPDLVDPVRELLEITGKPYIIENVIGAPLNLPVMLCGLMFQIKVLRHRLFECNFYCMQPGHPYHRNIEIGKDGYCCVVAHSAVKENTNYQYPNSKKLWQGAMGIDWMTKYELTQAIPPAYTEYIGKYLMQDLQRVIK